MSDYGTSSAPVGSGNGERRHAGSIGVSRLFTVVVLVDPTTGRAVPVLNVVGTRVSLANVPDGTDERECYVDGLNAAMHPRCLITVHGGINWTPSYHQADAACPLASLFSTMARARRRST